METLDARLIKKTNTQRFYKLSHKLKKGISTLRGKEIDLIEEMTISKEKDFKPDYKKFCPINGVDIICISDATTHLERLVFAGCDYGDDIGRTRVQIDGCFTMMTHGGDKSSMKPDYVYIRRLAKINGFEFHFNNLIN